MSAGKRYVLDANVFIEAHRAYYSDDICPGFWDALIRQHKASRISSIDKVKAELVGEHDYLSQWVKRTAPGTFFEGTADRKIIAAFSEIVNWVQNEQQFTSGAKAEFSAVADGWLVAFARVYGLVVVTHEKYAPDVRKKVPIPNVCVEFDVEYCSTFDMLRAVGERFVLKARRRRS